MHQKRALFPISIIIIGIIVATGIFVSKQKNEAPEIIIPTQDILDITPLSNDDHILGSPDAKVVIIEYADFGCPFCQSFHVTMERIIAEYGKNGTVAWVFRHFPVVEDHPLAFEAALASECVAELAGESIFWEYISTVFEKTQESLTLENLKSIAATYGVNETDFESCVILESHKGRVNRDIADGNKLVDVDSDFGTPYNIIISKTGVQTIISGDESYENLVDIIEAIK